jgi:hypothetical protein
LHLCLRSRIFRPVVLSSSWLLARGCAVSLSFLLLPGCALLLCLLLLWQRVYHHQPR